MLRKQSPTGTLHRSSKRPALGLCASAEPWEPSVRCPALPSTAPVATQHPQYAPVIALHQKLANNPSQISCIPNDTQNPLSEAIITIRAFLALVGYALVLTKFFLVVVGEALTSLAHEPPIRKLPGMVGGLKARQLMLSSGGEVTSTSCSVCKKGHPVRSRTPNLCNWTVQ